MSNLRVLSVWRSLEEEGKKIVQKKILKKNHKRKVEKKESPTLQEEEEEKYLVCGVECYLPPPFCYLCVFTTVRLAVILAHTDTHTHTVNACWTEEELWGFFGWGWGRLRTFKKRGKE